MSRALISPRGVTTVSEALLRFLTSATARGALIEPGTKMPSYEIRYLTSEGELALIHKTRHEDDEAVGRAAFRMLVGSGFADYEIWRDE